LTVNVIVLILIG